MKRGIILIFLFLLIVFSGCVETNISEKKNLPYGAVFYESYSKYGYDYTYHWAVIIIPNELKEEHLKEIAFIMVEEMIPVTSSSKSESERSYLLFLTEPPWDGDPLLDKWGYISPMIYSNKTAAYASFSLSDAKEMYRDPETYKEKYKERYQYNLRFNPIYYPETEHNEKGYINP